MLVRSHDRFDVVAEFDSLTGRLVPYPRQPGIGLNATSGWFAVLDGRCVVFFADQGQLKLRIGTSSFLLDSGTIVQWEACDQDVVLSVSDSSTQTTVVYRVNPPYIPADLDMTPFVSPEDWDLGLFVFNVMSDPERSELVRLGPSGRGN